VNYFSKLGFTNENNKSKNFKMKRNIPDVGNVVVESKNVVKSTRRTYFTTIMI
jgi:hypothetical protein